MEIKKFISKSFPIISYLSGVNDIEQILLENEYVVVVDDNDKFEGILTPPDLIKKPHKIVIDCLTEKEHIDENEDISSVIEKFNKSQTPIFPVFRDVDFVGVIKRKDIIDELETEVDELYEKSIISEKLKHNFLMNLSHEVRTPLNGILGFLDVLSELKNDDKTIDENEYKSIIKDCTDRFLLIMKDLIDLSLFHAGCNPDIQIQKIRIENIFSDLRKYFGAISMASEKNISIKFFNPDSLEFIFTDENKIKHILCHLIDNAIKFSDNSCTINFGYNIENDRIIFYVKNKGLPISNNMGEKIFNAFEKQENFNNKLVEGTGIGLTLVKNLAELLDGKISYVSNDGLTTFFCSIPIKNETNEIN